MEQLRAAVVLSTAAYSIVEFIGWSILAWIAWMVYVVWREVDKANRTHEPDPEPEAIAVVKPDPGSRVPDSDRYTSLMPIVATIESTPAIASRGAEMIDKVADSGTTFEVAGSTDTYTVSLDPISCSCAWWEHRQTTCKHIVAVAGFVLARVER